jgi:hypothetical protein
MFCWRFKGYTGELSLKYNKWNKLAIPAASWPVNFPGTPAIAERQFALKSAA